MVIPPAMFTQSEGLVIPAPAKINLFLEVVGKRPNGYHDLRSIVVPVALLDDVVLQPVAAGIETCIDPASPIDAAGLALLSGRDNLATRAAQHLRRATGRGDGVRITLLKRIPLGGGLGGGSADAAAVLLGLNRLWNLGLTRAELMAVGAQVGCDVPALIAGGAVCMEGVGERVVPLTVPAASRAREWWVVLVNPGVPIETRDIYARYKQPLTSGAIPYSNMVCALEDGEVETVAGGLFNGLQETVFRKYPITELVADALAQAGSMGVLVSGSGATVFGLARDRLQAEAVCEALPGILGGSVWRQVVRLLPDGVMVAHGPLEA